MRAVLPTDPSVRNEVNEGEVLQFTMLFFSFKLLPALADFTQSVST